MFGHLNRAAQVDLGDGPDLAQIRLSHHPRTTERIGTVLSNAV